MINFTAAAASHCLNQKVDDARDPGLLEIQKKEERKVSCPMMSESRHIQINRALKLLRLKSFDP